MDNHYKSLFFQMRQENKKLEDVLSVELYDTYMEYLAEIHSIVESILIKTGYTNRVKYSIYEDCCKIAMAGLMDAKENDYSIINNFINIYAQTNFNGNTALAIDATVRLIYNQFYNI